MEPRRRFGQTFSTWYNTDIESSTELNYQNTEEGPSRTEPTESSEEWQPEDPETDPELTTSFLQDSRNPLEQNPFETPTFPPITSIFMMAQPQQQTNMTNGDRRLTPSYKNVTCISWWTEQFITLTRQRLSSSSHTWLTRKHSNGRSNT